MSAMHANLQGSNLELFGSGRRDNFSRRANEHDLVVGLEAHLGPVGAVFERPAFEALRAKHERREEKK